MYQLKIISNILHLIIGFSISSMSEIIFTLLFFPHTFRNWIQFYFHSSFWWCPSENNRLKIQLVFVAFSLARSLSLFFFCQFVGNVWQCNYCSVTCTNHYNQISKYNCMNFTKWTNKRTISWKYRFFTHQTTVTTY